MPPRKSAKAARANSARDLRRADHSRAALISGEATPRKPSLSSTAHANQARAATTPTPETDNGLAVMDSGVGAVSSSRATTASTPMTCSIASSGHLSLSPRRPARIPLRGREVVMIRDLQDSSAVFEQAQTAPPERGVFTNCGKARRKKPQ